LSGARQGQVALGFSDAARLNEAVKTPIYLSVAVGLLLSGCGDKSSQPATTTNAASTGGSIATAPADYLSGLGKAQQSAVKTVDTTSVNKAIQLFNVDQGRNPNDLNELVEKHYLPQVPTPPFGTKLEYDATAGTVKVMKQ
jgi:hypothetical protein